MLNAQESAHKADSGNPRVRREQTARRDGKDLDGEKFSISGKNLRSVISKKAKERKRAKGKKRVRKKDAACTPKFILFALVFKVCRKIYPLFANRINRIADLVL